MSPRVRRRTAIGTSGTMQGCSACYRKDPVHALDMHGLRPRRRNTFSATLSVYYEPCRARCRVHLDFHLLFIPDITSFTNRSVSVYVVSTVSCSFLCAPLYFLHGIDSLHLETGEYVAAKRHLAPVWQAQRRRNYSGRNARRSELQGGVRFSDRGGAFGGV